jgi:hypothetical protein
VRCADRSEGGLAGPHVQYKLSASQHTADPLVFNVAFGRWCKLRLSISWLVCGLCVRVGAGGHTKPRCMHGTRGPCKFHWGARLRGGGGSGCTWMHTQHSPPAGWRTICSRSPSLAKDGASHPEIAELASLGSFGQWPSNVHSELTRKYLKNCTAPTADVISVPAIDPQTMKVCYSDCHVMGPHDWFGWMSDTFQPEFDQLFLSTPLDEFWPHVRRPQWVQRMPQASRIVVQVCFDARCNHCGPGTTRRWLGTQSGRCLDLYVRSG